MERSPAFRFYPADWFDYKVTRMGYFAQGCYFRLLCHMWRDSADQCSLPDDSTAIAALLALRRDQFRSVWKEIQWKGDPVFQTFAGRLVSKRLQEEKRKQLEYRKLKSEAGTKGAMARYGKAMAVLDSASPLPLAKDNSSSSSSITSLREEKRGEDPPAPVHRSGSVGDHLASTYKTSVRYPLAHVKAKEHIEAALGVGVEAQAIEAAFMDPKNKGRKIWEILDPMRPEPKKKTQAERVLEYLARRSKEAGNGSDAK